MVLTPMQQETQTEKTEESVTHILEEARMVLPGIQALVGFQFIAVFNQCFKSNLTVTEQFLHLAAIFFSLNSICLLMTPAALHRLGEPGKVSQEFAQFAGQLVAAGMVPLLLSFCLDFYLVAHLISANQTISCVISIFIVAEFTYFWFIMPLLRKKKFQR